MRQDVNCKVGVMIMVFTTSWPEREGLEVNICKNTSLITLPVEAWTTTGGGHNASK